jgi:DNA-binding Lrp family transcriptional regulator
MDEKDLDLLRILEENSRLSADEIATMTNLSKSEVEKRVSALEAAQVIRGYSTVINWERAGNGEVSAIIVATLQQHCCPSAREIAANSAYSQIRCLESSDSD